MRNQVPTLAGPAEALRMDLGLLRAVSVSLAPRFRATHDPLGYDRIKRQAERLRAMQRVRVQGRDAATSGMGRYSCRVPAVP
jgi:hypothetical protein